MSFGQDLWCPQAHAAVVRLLDSELHLMEAMKKWMVQRAKSERDFSVQLHHMTSIVEKMERSQHGAGPDYISQLNKSWGVLVSQTDVLSQLMKKSGEDLLAGPISKLTLLIRDKQQLHKTYTDQWNLLKQELTKVGDRRLQSSQVLSRTLRGWGGAALDSLHRTAEGFEGRRSFDVWVALVYSD